jgi:eukaryotic-like serine/threonine-protein kinase
VTLAVGADEHVFTGRVSAVLGRGPECDFRIRGDDRVSRRHCQVEIDPPEVSVRDLGSSNGTYVNGTPVQGESALRDGDELRVGDTTVRVSMRAEPIPGLRTLRELGRGAQGVVHLARHTASGRLVALKTLNALGPVDPAARAMFLREMDCTKALSHPNIVRFHESSADEFAFSCEYCAGGSVADLVVRRGRLPVDEAVPLVMQALAGLAYAHQAPVPVPLADGRMVTGRGLVHRDIKPQNLLLAGSVLKIADFGLAKAFDLAGLSGRTRTGAIGGSMAFMPRRQVMNYKYAQPDADLWAITACLYRMLTGETPRDFPPEAEPVAIVLREPPIPVRDRESAIPPRLAEVIDETLDESSTSPTSAAALAQSVRDALAG